MLRRVIHGATYSAGARDGDPGALEDLLFDDETWRVAFLVVGTGPRPSKRTVLIPPASAERVDWLESRIVVSFGTSEDDRGPGVAGHAPAPRRREADVLATYGLAAAGDGFGPQRTGTSMAGVPAAYPEPVRARGRRLLSTKEVTGYHLQAIDGDVGHVAGFVVDDDAWAIRYLVVETTVWWPRKRVLIAPSRIDHVSRAERRVLAGALKRAVETAPEYDHSAPLTSDDEARLSEHFENPVDWRGGDEGRRANATTKRAIIERHD